METSVDGGGRRGHRVRQHQPDALHIRTTPANFELPGVDAMAWDFAVPEPWELLGKQVVHVGYATVAIDDAVFAVSVPLHPG